MDVFLSLSVLLFTLLILLQIIDIVTTLKILELGGYEANPIMRKAMELFGVKPALIGVKSVYVILLLLAFLYLNSLVFWILMCLFYLAIVVNNVIVYKRLK
jgi:hypothetical protein